MFERDKADLREMGVPLETGRTSVFDTEDGYRIARAEYELPEIRLTGEEAAAVGLALRLWESAQLAGAGAERPGQAQGRRRRRRQLPEHPAAAAAGRRRARVRPRLRRRPRPQGARVRLPAPRRGRARPPAGAAVGRRRLARPLVPRRTRPRPPAPRGSSGSPASSARPRPSARPARSSRRTTSTSPRWSPARSAERSTSSWSAPVPGGAIGLRRHATSLGPADDGDDRLQLTTTEPWSLADQLAVYGADVVVESPAEIREAVIQRLTRLAARGCPHDRRRHHRPDDPPPVARPVPHGPAHRGRRAPRPPATSASPRSSCAATSSCCGCAACPATGPATSSTWPSRATACGSPSPPAWSARCG